MKHLGPHPTGIADAYWKAPTGSPSDLTLPWCESCQRSAWPPRWRCGCGARLGWKTVEGRGTLLSWSVVRRAVHPEMNDQVPYVVGFVRLQAGPVVFSNIVDVAPDELAQGLPLLSRRDVVSTGNEAFAVPVFGPMPEATSQPAPAP